MGRDRAPVATVLIAMIGLSFTIYFAYERFGTKVKATYTFGMTDVLEPQVTSVTLINYKNRPLAIFEIFAVFDGNVVGQLQKFTPPLVLKPLEALSVAIEPCSFYMLGEKQYVLDRTSATIHLALENKTYECKLADVSMMMDVVRKKRLAPLTRVENRHNGDIYGPQVKYVVTYRNGKEIKRAFMTKHGHIAGDDWPFEYNAVPPADAATREAVYQALGRQGHKAGEYWVNELREPILEIANPKTKPSSWRARSK
jgi:hypothetical protein